MIHLMTIVKMVTELGPNQLMTPLTYTGNSGATCSHKSKDNNDYGDICCYSSLNEMLISES